MIEQLNADEKAVVVLNNRRDIYTVSNEIIFRNRYKVKNVIRQHDRVSIIMGNGSKVHVMCEVTYQNWCLGRTYRIPGKGIFHSGNPIDSIQAGLTADMMVLDECNQI